MSKTSLNGQWELTYGQSGNDAPTNPEELTGTDWPTIGATVPGNVEIDLEAAGAIDNPTIGTRVFGLRKYETYEWWYTRSFSARRNDGWRVELVFEGLDCYGEVWLNGERVGDTDNMLIAHRFDVTDMLREENELAVRIRPAVLEDRKHIAEPYEWERGAGESIFTRKAPHMYGWDIMPRIVSAGLWRDVYLEAIPPTRFRSVYWATLSVNPDQRRAQVMVDWDFATERVVIDGMKVRATLTRNGRQAVCEEQVVYGTRGRLRLNLKDADLWYPRGTGEPALYEAALELLGSDGNVLASDTRSIGIRTIELRRTQVTTREEPGEFVFLVNGEKVFCRGGNWVPLDALLSRASEHMDRTLRQAAEMNCNMLRVWGGSVYEDHVFFDFCDREGIMVWQDFAFACHIYPQTDEFAERVRIEAEAVVRKLRNHTSLVVWVGDNEGDHVYEWSGMGQDPNTNRLTRDVLRRACLRLDPMRPYLPSSPYRGPELVALGNPRELMPEQHLYGKRPHFKDAFYTDNLAHFVGEIGYMGCPDRATIEQMVDADRVWPWQDNEQWRAKGVMPTPTDEKLGDRIDMMADLITRLFPEIPDNIDDFIAASQIVQAEAYKFWMEWWRVGMWRRTGMLWWQLRDGWPIFSAASIDYFNRPKLVYHYLTRSQAPVCAIIEEAADGRHQVTIVSDRREAIEGVVTVRDADDNSVLLEAPFTSDPNSKTAVGDIPQPEGQHMWLIDCTVGDEAYANHYLVGEPSFQLDDYRRWYGKLGVEKVLPETGERQ